MSRIGNMPILVPDSVSLKFDLDKVVVKGPLGILERIFKQKVVQFEFIDNIVKVKVKGKDNFTKSLHGLYRVLLSNMILGVQNLFQKKLILNGVGYKVQQKEKNILLFSLEYSHPVVYHLPDMIHHKIIDNGIGLILESCDKELVGQVAAEIRSLRPPEPYKKKGIRYADEFIMVKAGKASKK